MMDEEKLEIVQKVLGAITWAADPVNQRCGVTLELDEVQAMAEWIALWREYMAFLPPVDAEGNS